ncbi:hypothetical protein MKK75_03385 [Methylobacterium sp. J-030]|uniref:hypothetical protein n=1 Tax=Methylobacterium sp. J-030 TaxID=2836627 RepID=UPI001FBB828E|nr:hypothetical protein [Methylobacterium sp. J-030]MCJ2067860.1 hypothetical protein [Methylobacterium sp. J-030]
MVWFFGLAIAAVLMSLSEKAWGNPLTVFGLVPLGFCIAMLGSVFLKAAGLN